MDKLTNKENIFCSVLLVCVLYNFIIFFTQTCNVTLNYVSTAICCFGYGIWLGKISIY